MIDIAQNSVFSEDRTQSGRSAPHAGAGGFDISPRIRALVASVAVMLAAAALLALFRGLTGLAPDHGNIREAAVIVHLTAVLPAIPLGGYLLLARKGDGRHKALGRAWVGLMIVAAISSIFIGWSGGLDFDIGPIHLFVPLTLVASWKLVSAARRGDMKTHRGEVLTLFFGALAIPGLVAFLLPGRLMSTWLLG